MKIDQLYSHLNGYEFLIYHQSQIWAELQHVIEEIDASACKTKKSKEKTKAGRMLYSPISLNREFKQRLNQNDWDECITRYFVTSDINLARKTLNLDAASQKQEIEAAGKQALRAYNQTDFVKNRVAVEVQFGKYSFVAYDLFVKHMAFYIGNKIDVGIEILPSKSMQLEMSSGVGCYENEVYNVIRQGRNTPAVPLIIIGVVP